MCAVMLLASHHATATGQSLRDGFEVASIRANPSGTGVRGHSFPGNRFEARNVPLADLILVAYGDPGQLLPPARMSGGPSWINTDRFDVSAALGSNATSTVSEKQRRLRGLLAERFKLKVHTELIDRPMYEIELSRSNGTLGPQLRRAEATCEPLVAAQPGKRDGCVLSATPSGELMLRGQTMGALANALTILLGREVRDRTGLTDGFDADARFNPSGLPGMSHPAALDETPSLFSALENQLGLKLATTRGRVEVLVVDAAEHPTEN
jgi:uncharacterized protein (TIGR03435 family)